MAIALSTALQNTHATATSVTTASATVTVGDCIVAFCTTNLGTPTFSDSIGGTWIPIAQTWGPSGGSRNFTMYAAYSPNATNTSRTFTATGQGSGQITISVGSFSGLANATPFDKAAANATGNGTSLTSTTANTSFPNEVLIACGALDGTNATTWTQGAGYTSVGSSGNTSATNGPPTIYEYQIVAAQSTYNATATSTQSNNWCMALVAFSDTNSPAANSSPIAWLRA